MRDPIIEKPEAAHCDWRTFIIPSPETPPELLRALDTHFSHYVQPAIEGQDKPQIKAAVCPGCGKDLTGFKCVFFGGGFTWGIVHGEGNCSYCRWPATGHHFIRETPGGEVLATIRNLILPHHPSTMDLEKWGERARTHNSRDEDT